MLSRYTRGVIWVVVDTREPGLEPMETCSLGQVGLMETIGVKKVRVPGQLSWVVKEEIVRAQM